jgi:hypothetical protein
VPLAVRVFGGLVARRLFDGGAALGKQPPRNKAKDPGTRRLADSGCLLDRYVVFGCLYAIDDVSGARARAFGLAAEDSLESEPWADRDDFLERLSYLIGDLVDAIDVAKEACGRLTAEAIKLGAVAG